MTKDIVSALRPALVLTLLFALLLGIVYPLLMTGIGQTLLPRQANGSLVFAGSRPIGSALIGQSFTSDRYFHGRPSAAGKGYDGMASGGSNLGPAAQALADRVRGDVAALRRAGVAGAIPADLVTASGSGLDPDLSPDAARAQIARVARARGLAPARLDALVAAQTEAPLAAILGEPRVNVLALNRALDQLGRAP
ncbi:potassium-transporting ATPase subunit KdpC [Sphingomonas morindae]|uniref:Potassium-transporting ATPase KdpC subunit n=1 Tax=Sphingomonas morindae TaxID=1541170 RepID=A0ABY4XCU2_9SPHN|nr:potassium-transporting ATPase subunit KdpC [Sphingomonas morindae]USI74791.1 potassium-transporting ATPase subunit KdpC [Sphingomonas morindae]